MLYNVSAHEPGEDEALYVYRGVVEEKVAAFRDLLADEWPGADLRDTPFEPDPEDPLAVPEFMRQPQRI